MLSSTGGPISSKFPLILDLSLIQTIDYYTGIVFEVVSDNEAQARILGQGGRYDQLLGLYHPQAETIPGIDLHLTSKTYTKFCYLLINCLNKPQPAIGLSYQRCLRLTPPPLLMQKN